MTLSKTHILAALVAATALSGCLSTGGSGPTAPSTGGSTGGGSTGGGSTGGGSTGGGSTGGGSTGGGSTGGGSTGGGSTGGSTGGGSTGGGTGALTVAEFDAEDSRIGAMAYSTSMPAAVTARYEGAVKMTGADFSSGLRTIEMLGDLALDLDYTTGGGVGNMATNTAETNVWTGGVTNLRGTVTTAGVGGGTTDDLTVSGSLEVKPFVTGGSGTPGVGYNNQVSYYGGLPAMQAYMDASGMVLEGKGVSGIVGLAGQFKGTNQEYIDLGAIAPLTIDDGGGASHQINFTATGYAEKQ